MALVQNPNGSPYPTIGEIMNLARTRVNDTALDLAGELLANDQPYTETLLNSAWRWLQTQCSTKGIETPIREAEISGLPISYSIGAYPVQAVVTWLGCSDGVNLYETPSLPPDLYLPLKVWRRQTGAMSGYSEMRPADNGLPVWQDCSIYDWREDGLYFQPDTYAQDMRLRYIAKRANLILVNTNDFVPIMYCEGAMSARIAYEYANLRGSLQAPTMQQLADDEFAVLAQGTGRKNQRRNMRRRSFGRRGMSCW